MSPLQYQTQLRLQEARSILRNERKDVGFRKPSCRLGERLTVQREYSRLFGKPLVREISDAGSPTMTNTNVARTLWASEDVDGFRRQ